MPRWRGLNHFSEVMRVSFTDGAKYEDISKVRQLYVASSYQLIDSESPQVVVFATHNIIPRDDKEGWLLLLCLRSFSILDLLLSFEVHTEKTILAGRKELLTLGRHIKVFDLFILMTPWC